MFSRRSCYFFVRPKRSFLEVCVFLGRALKSPRIRRVDRVSKSKVVHIVQVRHRDEVEAPLTDWLQEAYELSEAAPSKAAPSKTATRGTPKKAQVANKRKTATKTSERRPPARRSK
jgi:hypothetical protein